MEKEISKETQIKICKKRLEIILSSFGIILSLLSLYVAAKSLYVAEGVREDNRAIERLDLEPKISFRATLNSIEDIPYHFTIGNLGAVSATHVLVELIYHYYDPSSATNRVLSVYGSEEQIVIEELAPLQIEAFVIPQNFIDMTSRSGQFLQNNIMEARISYRKDPDRKLFVKRVFYFINNEGEWVKENDSSVNSNFYLEMKEALLNKYRETSYPSDILHDVNF